jgi:ADP-ribosyl-[dinitrogen reductase] hydrolase
MALAVAKAGAHGTLDPIEVARNFLAWVGSSPKDVGIQTFHVLYAAQGDPSRLAVEAATYFRANPKHAAGNGSLMRTAPRCWRFSRHL